MHEGYEEDKKDDDRKDVEKENKWLQLKKGQVNEACA